MTTKQKNKEAFWQSSRKDTSLSRNIKALVYILLMSYLIFDGCILPSFLRGYGETTYATITRIGKSNRIYRFADIKNRLNTGHEAIGVNPDNLPGDTIAVKYLIAFPKINKSVDETKLCVLSVKSKE